MPFFARYLTNVSVAIVVVERRLLPFSFVRISCSSRFFATAERRRALACASGTIFLGRLTPKEVDKGPAALRG